MGRDSTVKAVRGKTANRWTALRVAAGVLVLLATLGAAPSGAGPLSPQEKRGRHIYLKGSSPSGQPMTAVLGSAGVDVPAVTLPCASCHGSDGQGRAEGALAPPNITWASLTKAYGHTHASGRIHPAYAAGTLRHAILDGLDPAGNRLGAAMPRYAMTREDLADLLAYLKRLGTETDPGLTETGIGVGTILPTTGPLAQVGQAMKAVMTAYFSEINGQGGIYNRKIELRVSETGESPLSTAANAQRLIEREAVFALTGAFLAGAEEDLATLIEDEGIPLVGAFTLFPQESVAPRRHIFYVYSGLREQARSLVDFATQTLRIQNPRAAILYPEGEIAADVVGAIEAQGKTAGWGSVTKVPYASERWEAAQVARELAQGGVDAVFFLGSGADASALLKETATLQRTPTVFLLGMLVGKGILDAPVAFTNRLFLAFPTLATDQTGAGVREYRALAAKYALPRRHLAAQLVAYSGARILVEGLKRAGRELSREKLVTALEGLYEFETGVTPPITYGPNRRIGAVGAYIVSVDLEKKRFIPASGWITPGG